jgi:hypothetical protein
MIPARNAPPESSDPMNSHGNALPELSAAVNSHPNVMPESSVPLIPSVNPPLERSVAPNICVDTVPVRSGTPVLPQSITPNNGKTYHFNQKKELYHENREA